MSRRLIIFFAALAYALAVIVIRRLRRRRAARRGLNLARLEGFDHQGLCDELEPLFRAGRLPWPERGDALEEVGEGGSTREVEERFSVQVPELGEAVRWTGPADFDPARDPRHDAFPEVIRQAVTRIRRGELAAIETLVEPGQSAELDQAFAALGVHAFLTALYGGDLDRATEVLDALPGWTNGRIAPRLVDVYRGQIAFLRAERETGAARARFARQARRHLDAAAATSAFAEPAVRALWAKTLLRFHTHALNVEVMDLRIGRHLKAGLREHPHAPALFFELAYLLARRGEVAAAIDNLARAAYFSGSRDFYCRPLREDPLVARLKPGLVAQVATREA